MTNQTIEIKRLTITDLKTFKQLIFLFQEVFEHEHHTAPSGSYLEELLSRSDFVAYVVSSNNKLVGGLTAYELRKYYSDESEFFIYDIAIKPEFQRNGLGAELLSALKHCARKRRIKEIFVAAHEEDMQAVNFYHSTKGQAERVVHFNYFS